MSAQLRALKDYAKANGYSVAREYVDEAESGRVADRPQFKEMIEEDPQRHLKDGTTYRPLSPACETRTS